MIITNRDNLPQIFVNAVVSYNKKYTKGEADWSTTELIDSPMQSILKKKHHAEIVVDVKQLLWMFWGSMGHQIAEEAACATRVIMKEQRQFVKINDKTISGCPDLYYEREDSKKVCADYKFPAIRAIHEGVKDEYEKQINIYAYMLRENGYPVDELELTAWIRDWNPYCDIDNPVITLPVRKFKQEAIRTYLEKRVAMHTLYASDLLGRVPECTPKERWQHLPTYSIMKTGNIRQTGANYDSEEDALRMVESLRQKHPKSEYSVIKRHSVNKRCQYYCTVSRFCWWWNTKEEERPNSYDDQLRLKEEK